MCCRARTPKNFQVRANMMIKKKFVKNFCCYDQKQQPPIFPHLFFLLVFVAATKKCCQTVAQHQRKVLFRKFFSKSLDFGNCINNMNRSALERGALCASFTPYSSLIRGVVGSLSLRMHNLFFFL